MADNVSKGITAEVLEALKAGVENVFNSGKYQQYLDAMAKLYDYSARNCVLIAMQRPDAEYVAGMQSWNKNFARHVNKGEKAIKILAPCTYKKTIPEVVTDKDDVPVIDDKGEVVTRPMEKELRGFKVAYVFDVSQTHGKEFPELAKRLSGDVADYEKVKKAIEATTNCKVIYGNTPQKVNGFYSAARDLIVVNKGLSQEQTIKTLIHEAAHSRLHDPVDGAEKTASKNSREVQAESVAYIVCRRLGIDASDYSFGYVAGWGSGKDHKELTESLDVIKTEADKMYATICTELKIEPTIKPAVEVPVAKAVM